eukprot:9797121-Lingulodinium_polyedra.AAC.1
MLLRAEPDDGVVDRSAAALRAPADPIRVGKRAAQLFHHPEPFGSIQLAAWRRGCGPSDGPRSSGHGAPVAH